MVLVHFRVVAPADRLLHATVAVTDIAHMYKSVTPFCTHEVIAI